MNDRLQGALDELAPILNVSDPAACVERVGLVGSGTLSLSVADADGRRWFLFDDRGVVEQVPGRDSRIPVARTLGEDDHILAYRPRRRLVLERRGGGATQVLKGYRRGRSEDAARRHRSAEAAARTRSFRVPRLLTHDARLESLCFAKVEGSHLSLHSLSSQVFHDIGMFLAVFQGDADFQQDPLFTHEDELLVLDRWERTVLRIQGRLPEGWRVCREEIAAAGEHLPSPQWGLCHRDLHDGQFLETSDGIALLDFDLLSRADVALDAGNLIAHIALRSFQDPRIDQGKVQRFSEALLSGLGRGAGREFRTRIRFYEASACLRLALVYAVRPRWAHVSPRLQEIASRRLREIGVLL